MKTRTKVVAKKNKLTVEEEIGKFLQLWDCDSIERLLEDTMPLLSMYTANKDSNWIRDSVGSENYVNVMFARTVYIISRIAQIHTGKLLRTTIEFKDLWIRMETEAAKESTCEVA